jgi:hypothetical protein
MSGKAAGVVAASWKGRMYIRKLVIPSNPQSDAQDVVRESMARCMTLWRSLSATIKAFLTTYGTRYQMSGWNVYASKNRKLEETEVSHKVVPDNSLVQALNTFAAATGAGAAGTLELTWASTVITGYTKVAVIARKATVDHYVGELLTTLESAHTYVFTGLTPGASYNVTAWLYRPASAGVTADMGTTASGTANAHA